MAAGPPVEMVRALRAAAVQGVPSGQDAAAAGPDALVAQALAASELCLVAELRRARIQSRRFVERARDPLPVPDGSNALSV